MRPLNLREFATQLRMEGNPFADEILDLLDIQADVAEPYSELCDDLEHYAKGRGAPGKQLEWLGDRAALLADIEKQLREAGLDGDADDEIRELIANRPEPAPQEYDL